MGYLELAKKVVTEGVKDIQPISPEALERISQAVLNDLGRRCVQGLMEGSNPDVLAQVNMAQAGINQAWKDALEGKATLENFKVAVARWHEAVINLFSVQRPKNIETGRLF